MVEKLYEQLVHPTSEKLITLLRNTIAITELLER